MKCLINSASKLRKKVFSKKVFFKKYLFVVLHRSINKIYQNFTSYIVLIEQPLKKRSQQIYKWPNFQKGL